MSLQHKKFGSVEALESCYLHGEPALICKTESGSGIETVFTHSVYWISSPATVQDMWERLRQHNA
jgi:hypothetical protein